MEDLNAKLSKIFTNLETDRGTALAEFAAIKADAELAEPRYRHKVREIGGQLLKLAIDASIGMAKILEPMTKNTIARDGLVVSKKELLEALEAVDSQLQIPVAKETVDLVVDTKLDDIDELTRLAEQMSKDANK